MTSRAGSEGHESDKNVIDKILFERIIDLAQTVRAAPIVFPLKKDGSLRFCVDYRKLYAVTNSKFNSIQLMDECIDWLGGAAVFCTIDANSGYMQTKIEHGHRDNTSIPHIRSFLAS